MGNASLSWLDLLALERETKPSILLEILIANWALVLLAIPACFVFHGIVLAIYRLFLPLAGFPGSKVAAATGWYEFYYDVIDHGRYYYKINQMHDKYGKLWAVHPLS
ncbi:hypothetical protein ACJZ2D_017222 [Fusarium nematophilum]